MAKEITVKLDEKVVAEIQALDSDVQTKQAVIASFLDMHAGDTSAAIVESPILAAYQKQLTEAKIAFEQAKDRVINDKIDAETQKNVTTWAINYSKCELTYVVA